MLSTDTIRDQLLKKGYRQRNLHMSKHYLLQKYEDNCYKYVLIINNEFHKVLIVQNLKNLIDQLKTEKYIQKNAEILLIIRNNEKPLKTRRMNVVSYSDMTFYGFVRDGFIKEYKLVQNLFQIDRLYNKKKYGPALFYPGTPVTYMLLAINICLFFLVKNPAQYGFSKNSLLESSHYVTMFTYMFMHSGLLHLIANMVSLYVVGKSLEHFIGSWKLLYLYILGGLYAAYFSIVLGCGYEITVGASGSIFALVGAYSVNSVLHSEQKLSMLFKRLAIDGSLIMVSIYNPLINNWCHVGGYLAGIGLSASLEFLSCFIGMSQHINIHTKLKLFKIYRERGADTR